MQVFDLFNTKYEQDLKEGAVDRLEQRRIDDLNARMDDLLARAKQAVAPEHRAALKREFEKVKSERDSYYQVKEASIGQDIVNKSEKMARATPPTPAGKVASTVKHAARWLAGKGGPGKEGPTYEGADDIEDRGEYDQEGNMAKDNIHTIVRNARELESILGDNDNLPEWVQDKLANIKGMMTSVSEYMQTQQERDHEEATGEEGVTMAEWKKESDWKEIPKSKSGRPVDPRGEVTHLSDVARRETERKLAQKKNSKAVDEDRARDLTAAVMLKKAHAAFPIAKNDAEALALWIADKEQRDVNRLERENEHEEEMIARIADQLKNSEVEEGWSNKMVARRTGQKPTPYSVFIKGKEWKSFPDDDHAENVANKLRAKFKSEGRDPSVITIAPTGYDKDIKEDHGSWIVYDPETKQIKKRFKTHTAGKSYAKTHGLGFASSEYYFDNVKQPVNEFAPSPERDDSDDIPDQLVTLANRWWNAAGDQPKIESVLRSLGWSIHQVESEDDAVQLMHDDGTTYFISADDFDPEVFEDQNRVDPIIIRALERLTPGLQGSGPGSELFTAAKEALALEIGLLQARKDSTFVEYLNQLQDLYRKHHSVDEAQTDYSKRRQRERDIDAGRPVAKQRTPKQTDYQRRRAQDKKDMELGEEKTRLDPKCWKGKKIGNPKTKMKGGVRVNNCVPAESVEEEAKKGLYYYVNKRKKAGTSRDKDDPRAPSAQDWKDAAKTAKKESVEEEWSEKYKRSINCSHPKGFSQKAHCAGRKKNEGMFSTLGEDQDTSAVESAIIRRIMVAHLDWLQKFGPEKVMQAAEEVAYNVGDVDEIGTSDVSAYVHEVGQILGA